MLFERDFLDHGVSPFTGAVSGSAIFSSCLYRILGYDVPTCKAAETAGAYGWNASMNRLVPNDKSQVQVIARAATILRALEDENAGLSLGQIAQRVNLARSTVQRIVSALQTEKLVIAATPNGRVRLGPTILRLAASVRSDFTALARPFIVRLSEELHETVDLSMVKKDHLVFIDQVIGSQRLRTVSAVGETFPLYCTANGKAYLAQLTDAQIATLIGDSYEARTPKTHHPPRRAARRTQDRAPRRRRL